MDEIPLLFPALEADQGDIGQLFCLQVGLNIFLQRARPHDSQLDAGQLLEGVDQRPQSFFVGQTPHVQPIRAGLRSAVRVYLGGQLVDEIRADEDLLFRDPHFQNLLFEEPGQTHERVNLVQHPGAAIYS